MSAARLASAPERNPDGPFKAELHRGGPSGVRVVLRRVLTASAFSMSREEFELVRACFDEADAILAVRGEWTAAHTLTDLKQIVESKRGGSQERALA